MKQATAPQLRTCMSAATELMMTGIYFVPVPATYETDVVNLVDMASVNLEILLREAKKETAE